MATVLVTGATRGIGRACASLLVGRGQNVIGIYHQSEADASALASTLNAAGPGKICFYACDLASPAMRQALPERTGPVDALINNAGVALTGVFQTLQADDIRRLYEINLHAALDLTRAYLPAMLRAGQGNILNISSVFGEHGGSCEVDYSASKAALIGFTKALAKEVGPSGVRVNCLCPGVIDTDMNAALSVEDIRALVDETPLERLGTPEDVARAAMFLLSEEASFITGAVLDVNGGFGI